MRYSEHGVELDGEELLRAAIFLHGHLGPYLVLGVKAGLLAVDVLGRDPLGSRVEVELPGRIPYTCFLDGLQISTGCTLGKGNIRVENTREEHIRVLYENRRGSVEIEVRREVLEEVNEALSAKRDQRELAMELWNREPDRLFSLSEG